jgi:uncharacterized protein (DUF1800 family)
MFGLLLILLSPSLLADSSKLPPQKQIDKAAHLLNRATFGPRPEEINQLAEKGDDGLQVWLEAQMKSQTISDPEVEKKLRAFKTLSMTNQQLATAIPKLGKEKSSKKNKSGKAMDEKEDKPKLIVSELIAQKFIRATESKHQFREVLTDFWFNHFNVDFKKGQTKWLITSYERDVIRPMVFGKFKDLLIATAKSPAMLFYLDNAQSVKSDFAANPKNKKNKPDKQKNTRTGINENYARELMELHTLGVDGGYTQKDVMEVARILTGWTIDRKDDAMKFVFRPAAHDQGAKTVLNVAYPAKRGEEEGIKLLEFLARQPATAKHISYKLAQRFVSDEPPATLVDKLSKKYLSTDGDLTAVYRELFESPEFWSEKAVSSKIKKPFHWMVSMIRAVGGTIEIDSIKEINQLDVPISQMGEAVYRCQPPTGFKETAEYWVNPGALVTRMNFALRLSHQRVNAVTYSQNYFRTSLRSSGAMGKYDESLKQLDRLLMGSALSEQTIKKISAEFADEPQVQDEIDAKNPSKPKYSVNLGKMLGLLLGSPEFQRF